jgi:Tfp pilus assembly protein PilN
MKRLTNMEGAGLFIDIGQSSLKAVRGEDAFEFPLERGENGRLTDLCRERLTVSLRGFLGKPGRWSGESAWCAIGARGVSLRRLNLPASARDEFERVLRLQIESEFPLSPEELAWGWRATGPAASPAGGGSARQEVLVVAVKRDMLEDYAGIFGVCGVVPIFTLAALARAALYPPQAGTRAVLNIGRTHTEWVSFDQGGPNSIRILPWGGENITLWLQGKLGLSHDEAERIKIATDPVEAGPDKGGGPFRDATGAVAALAEYLRPAASGTKIYLTGKSARDPRLAPLLARLLGGGVSCESLEAAAGNAHSTAIAGLRKATVKNSASPPLVLELKEGRGAAVAGGPPAWKWAVAAALLALGAVFLPYAEALALKPRLDKKLASVDADLGRLDTIDQELKFLQDLKQEQPPYLDTLYLLAKSAPPGMRLDTLSLGRKGEISLRAKMGNSQQVTDFRAKLIDSGWFASVVVEEQVPGQQNVTVRMTAQLNPAAARKPLVVEASTKKSDHARPMPMEAMPMMAPDEMQMPMPPPGMSAPRGVGAEPRAGAPRGGRRGRRGGPGDGDDNAPPPDIMPGPPPGMDR